MKIKKVQTELFQAMTRENGFVKTIMCGKTKLFTANGFVGYALADADNIFDNARIDHIEGGITAFDEKKDVPLRPTRAATYDYSGRAARRYEADDFAVYINPDLLKFFDDAPYKLFGRGPVERVVVRESDSIVGIILPVRVQDGDPVEFVVRDLKND